MFWLEPACPVLQHILIPHSSMPTRVLLAATVMRNVYVRLAPEISRPHSPSSAWSSPTNGSSSLRMDACSYEETTYSTDYSNISEISDNDAESEHRRRVEIRTMMFDWPAETEADSSAHDSMPALVTDSDGDSSTVDRPGSAIVDTSVFFARQPLTLQVGWDDNYWSEVAAGLTTSSNFDLERELANLELVLASANYDVIVEFDINDID